ncbi:MAG: PIN domain-containing protein [Candidatus Manganitrophaceae bacterium]
MLCIDTSSLIAFLEGAQGVDVDLVDQAFSDEIGVVAPVTLSEILSDPKLQGGVRAMILQLPTLPILDGYWERAGLLRAKVLGRGRRARLADTLIAQSCLDHGATLVTRDDDFKIFKQIAGLKMF